MVGYSRLMEADEADTLARRNSIRTDLVDPTIGTYHGHVVKGTGDGLLAEFASAVDAVECAAEIQREMAERDQGELKDRRIQFRIGINVGDIVSKDGDIFGDGVNVASRIESLADPGGILVSDSAYSQVHNKLKLGFEDLGLQSLKNLERPVRVYRVLLDPAAAETVPGHRDRPKFKQRQIVQWAVAYFASAWLSLELFDLVAEQFLWPIWIRQGATIFLLFGLLITLVLAWYHGEKGRQKVSPGELVLLTALLVLAGGSVWTLKNRSANSPAVQSSVAGFSFRQEPLPENSVAVLPCSNFSADADREYFADGLAAELITRLSFVSELRVPSQTSSFSFKGRDASIGEVASALRVRHVLECNVSGDGSRLRVSTRLVDAETGYTLWSEVYDREAAGLLDVQQEIAQTVVARLEVELRGNEVAQLTRRWTENPQAYDHFLRGMQYQLRTPTPDNVASGIRHFEQAIEIDSTFGRAYARLAVQQIVIGNYMLGPAEEAYLEAERLARRAIELDGKLFEAYWALGWTEFAYRHEWQKAREHFQRTISLAPGEWAGYHSLGLVEGTLGRTEQALEAARIATNLDPLAYWPSWGLYAAHYRRGDYDMAATQLESMAELHSDDPYLRLELGILLIRMGRKAEADRYLADAQRLDGGRSPPWMQAAMAMAPAILGDTAEALAIVEPIARAMESSDTYQAAGVLSMVYAELGRRDEAMRWLTEARASYDVIVTYLVDPAYDSLRDDPRFAALIRDLGLPEDVYLRTND